MERLETMQRNSAFYPQLMLAMDWLKDANFHCYPKPIKTMHRVESLFVGQQKASVQEGNSFLYVYVESSHRVVMYCMCREKNGDMCTRVFVTLWTHPRTWRCVYGHNRYSSPTVPALSPFMRLLRSRKGWTGCTERVQTPSNISTPGSPSLSRSQTLNSLCEKNRFPDTSRERVCVVVSLGAGGSGERGGGGYSSQNGQQYPFPFFPLHCFFCGVIF